jgi:hypothetical protein
MSSAHLAACDLLASRGQGQLARLLDAAPTTSIMRALHTKSMRRLAAAPELLAQDSAAWYGRAPLAAHFAKLCRNVADLELLEALADVLGAWPLAPAPGADAATLFVDGLDVFNYACSAFRAHTASGEALSDRATALMARLITRGGAVLLAAGAAAAGLPPSAGAPDKLMNTHIELAAMLQAGVRPFMLAYTRAGLLSGLSQLPPFQELARAVDVLCRVAAAWPGCPAQAPRFEPAARQKFVEQGGLLEVGIAGDSLLVTMKVGLLATLHICTGSLAACALTCTGGMQPTEVLAAAAPAVLSACASVHAAVGAASLYGPDFARRRYSGADGAALLAQYCGLLAACRLATPPLDPDQLRWGMQRLKWVRNACNVDVLVRLTPLAGGCTAWRWRRSARWRRAQRTPNGAAAAGAAGTTARQCCKL